MTPHLLCDTLRGAQRSSEMGSTHLYPMKPCLGTVVVFTIQRKRTPCLSQAGHRAGGEGGEDEVCSSQTDLELERWALPARLGGAGLGVWEPETRLRCPGPSQFSVRFTSFPGMSASPWVPGPWGNSRVTSDFFLVGVKKQRLK